MTDPTPPRPSPRDPAGGGDQPSTADREELSAYLSGDLGDDRAAALEARLADDAALAAELDAMADLLVLLRGVEDVEPPPGFAVRLEERLVAARAEQDPAAAEQAGLTPAAGADGPGGEVASLDARRRRRGSTPAWLAAAACVALVAVAGTATLRGAQEGGDAAQLAGDAQVESAEGEGAEETAVQAPAAAGDRGEQAMEDAALAQRAAPSAPALTADGPALADADEARAWLAQRPTAEALLGLPVAQATEVAASFRLAIERAPAFPDGRAPGECLGVLLDGAPQPLVPAEVAAVEYAGAPALAYVLVGLPDAAPGDEAPLSRREVWVVEPGTCATRVYATA